MADQPQRARGRSVDPTFLIIGAPACGTRWLRLNLAAHPDIYLPSEDLAFFAPPFPPPPDSPFVDPRLRSEKNKPWYRYQFRGRRTESCIGELSPGYGALGNDPVAVSSRIQGMLPDVRLLVLVRDPVERMQVAAHSFMRRGRLPVDADLMRLVEDDDPVVAELGLESAGRYTKSLYPFHRRFGDQLAVIVFDDLRDRPTEAYGRAVAHLGADPGFVPETLARPPVEHGPPPGAKALTDEARRVLFNRFRSDVEELSELIDRDLSAWDPGPVPVTAVPGE
jgi:hypothetical protein